MAKRTKAQAKGAGSSLRRRQTLLAWGFALPVRGHLLRIHADPSHLLHGDVVHRHHLP